MKKIIYITIAVLGIFACQKNEPDNLFDGKTPSERFEQSQNELRTQLTTPQQGWKLTYFTDNKKFGGFTFLMKFTPEGFVNMASDISATATPTTSKYEIKLGQGTLLSFTTKNYIHELSDAMQGEQGKGLKGEFEFIYLGKEGNKLKFKNLLSNQPSQLYFEPLTATDEAQFPNLPRNIVPLTEHTSHYLLKVSTATASPTLYPITFTNRVLALQGTTVKAPVKATENGNALVPPLTIEGKSFSDLTRSGSTETPTYSATIEGVTVELYYSLISPEVFNSDDYLAIVNDEVSAFTYLESSFKNSAYTSKPFHDNFLAIDSEKAFNSITLRFKAGNKVDLVIG